jgi:hypothetical protein
VLHLVPNSDKGAKVKIKTMSAALILAAMVGATAVPATAATMMTTGTIQVWVTPNVANINSPVSKIIITGVIGDWGTGTIITKNGTPNDNGDYVKIALQKGGFEVNSIALNKKTNNAPALEQNNATCTVVFGGTGPVTLFNGTGAYTGITGTLQITERFAGIGPRFTSGAKKGQCNPNSNLPPVAFYGSITGTGKVSFG